MRGSSSVIAIPGILLSGCGRSGVVRKMPLTSHRTSPAATAEPKPVIIQRLRCRREPSCVARARACS
ncbi:MAG: hypothetical protein EX272_06215 [Chromatiales bacterium]|nr:MAG: hypothetical protein EX272_06215 [Chromatiales bacterium]